MDVYDEIVRLRREGRRCALATIINARGSIPSVAAAKMLVRDDGSIVGTVGGGCVEAEVWQGAREAMKEEKPRTLTFNLDETPDKDTGLVCGGTLQVFVEPVLPPCMLYIFGAGHVGFNVYKIARLAGFEVVVVDDRDSYANRKRSRRPGTFMPTKWNMSCRNWSCPSQRLLSSLHAGTVMICAC